MTVKCKEVAQLLESGGRAALDDHPEELAHIGECETCADKLVEVELAELAAPPPRSPVDVAPATGEGMPPASTGLFASAATPGHSQTESTDATAPPIEPAFAPSNNGVTLFDSSRGPTAAAAPPIDEPGLSPQPGLTAVDTGAPPMLPAIPPQPRSAVPADPGAPPTLPAVAPQPQSATPADPGAPPTLPAVAPQPQSATVAGPASPPSTSQGMESQSQLSWLPTDLPPPALDEPLFGGRRSSLRIRIKPTHFGLGLFVSAVVGGLFVLVPILLMQRSDSPQGPSPDTHASAADQGEVQVAPDLVPVFSSDEPVEQPKESPSPHRAKRKGGKADKHRPPKGEPTRSEAATQKLDKVAISTGIKTNLAKLGPCFKAAQKRGEITPGRHVLVLDFRILPNGSVRDGKLNGPDYLTKKRMAKCLAGKLRTWRFPASKGGSPVRNLQLPINVK